MAAAGPCEERVSHGGFVAGFGASRKWKIYKSETAVTDLQLCWARRKLDRAAHLGNLSWLARHDNVPGCNYHNGLNGRTFRKSTSPARSGCRRPVSAG